MGSDTLLMNCDTSGQVAATGATGYDLGVDGTTVVNDVTSPYTYVPGDTSSHSYEVRRSKARRGGKDCTSRTSP